MELEVLFDQIAAAIHEKDGAVDGIPAKDFPARIRAIPTGGLGGVALESIEITAPPFKTYYMPGEPFDPSGMAVYARFSNGQSMYVSHSGLVFDPAGPLDADTASVTVSFQWGLRMASAVQPVSVAANLVFGVCWSYGEPSSALARLTPETDPNGLVTAAVRAEPAPAAGNGPGSSPFDRFLPWAGMEEYNIVGGRAAYKRGEEGFSRTDFDTMVYIPPFYYAVVDDPEGRRRYWYVSGTAAEGLAPHPGSGRYLARYACGAGYVSKSGLAPQTAVTRAQARAGCAGRGDGWRQYDFAAWCAVGLLYLVEFADWDSQKKVGMGLCNQPDGGPAPSGRTDGMAYHTGGEGASNGLTCVQYRGLENLWGNVLQWVDGIDVRDCAVYLAPQPGLYGSAESYTPAGVSIPSAYGCIKAMGMGQAAPWAFLPSEAADDPGGYIRDFVFPGEGGRALCVGGAFSGWPNAAAVGLFCFDASYAEGQDPDYIGARLMFVPEEAQGRDGLKNKG